MKVAALLLLVGASAGLWGWALYARKPPDPLPRDLVGEYVIFRFEPPKGVAMANPFPPWQEWRYSFHSDRTYLIRVIVADGYEMTRMQGVLEVDGDRIALTRVSENAVASPADPDRFLCRWLSDKKGAYLLLTGDPDGRQIYLRPRR